VLVVPGRRLRLRGSAGAVVQLPRSLRSSQLSGALASKCAPMNSPSPCTARRALRSYGRADAQLRCAGGAQERHCRFCQHTLPDWCVEVPHIHVATPRVSLTRREIPAHLLAAA
jgi:hypothetical protein